MSKFLVLYRAPESAPEQLENVTPEQRQAGLEAWRAWASRVDYALADLGAPIGHKAHIGPGDGTMELAHHPGQDSPAHGGLIGTALPGAATDQIAAGAQRGSLVLVTPQVLERFVIRSQGREDGLR